MNRFQFKKVIFLVLCVATFAIGGSGRAHAVVITFDEVVSGTLLQGLTIGNVTFDFTLGAVMPVGGPPDGPIIGNFGPGATPLISPNYVEGDAAGIVGLNFATPVHDISYSFAVNCCGAPIPDASAILIFNALLNPIGSASGLASVPPAFSFPEGTVSIWSNTPISRAEITFDVDPANRFALDTIDYGFTNNIIPEPTTLFLILPSLLGLGLRKKFFQA